MFKNEEGLNNPYGLWENESFDNPYALYELMKKNAIKGRAKGEGDHLTPCIVHTPLCICFCNLISSSIVLQ